MGYAYIVLSATVKMNNNILSLSKKRFFYLFLVVYLVLLFVLFELFPRYSRYLSFYIVSPLIIVFYFDESILMLLKRNSFFHICLLMQILLIFYYINDFDSLLNLSMLFLTFVSLNRIALWGAYYYGSKNIQKTLACILPKIGICVFFISIMLTTIGWPTAPDWYPWEALYTNKRFVLMKTTTTHNILFWILGFPLAYWTRSYFLSKNKNIRVVNFISIAIVVFIFLISKSRKGILYVFAIILSIFSYKRVLSPFILGAISILLVFCLFLLFTFPFVAESIFSYMKSIQKVLKFTRILSDYEDAGRALTSGRDILSISLLKYSSLKPLTGLGDSHEVFKYGISKQGVVDIKAEKTMSSESPLFLAVKYGWPYFIACMIIIFVPFVKAMRNYYGDYSIYVITCINMIMYYLVTENFFVHTYSTSGFFLLQIFFFSFWGTKKKSSKLRNTIETI